MVCNVEAKGFYLIFSEKFAFYKAKKLSKTKFRLLAKLYLPFRTGKKLQARYFFVSLFFRHKTIHFNYN